MSQRLGKRATRYRLYLFNRKTGLRQRALAKHAEMLSHREACAIIKRTAGRMGEWEYRKEPIL